MQMKTSKQLAFIGLIILAPHIPAPLWLWMVGASIVLAVMCKQIGK